VRGGGSFQGFLKPNLMLRFESFRLILPALPINQVRAHVIIFLRLVSGFSFSVIDRFFKMTE